MGQLEDAEAFVDLAENGEVALRMAEPTLMRATGAAMLT